MLIRVTVPPTAEALSLDDVRPHLRVDADDDNDKLIARAIVAARQRVEREIGRPLLPQTCSKQFESFARRMPLWEDVTKIVSVSYMSESGETDSLAAAQFYVTGGRTLNVVGDLPVAHGVTVDFECGAFDQGSVPESIQQWMLLQIGAMDVNRAAVESIQTYELPDRWTDGLIDGFRVYMV
ncbi:phage head-tail connector protein [Burkholderia plantarii]|uniref:head-tail connector protein n=1 Tax=Burkholderia plantarii TaxID=41899 RepID=UPI00272D999F|nr:phage head-tail connector protein [Burkholderia plantarii]WLE60240.1 phage head-tail connector protein [Burkholderia plantarii]